jgi:hypothetical protein
MWILLTLIIIGIGTVISLLKEQTNNQKKIIELLERDKK